LADPLDLAAMLAFPDFPLLQAAATVVFSVAQQADLSLFPATFMSLAVELQAVWAALVLQFSPACTVDAAANEASINVTMSGFMMVMEDVSLVLNCVNAIRNYNLLRHPAQVVNGSFFDSS
jgi:hypothetical protein